MRTSAQILLSLLLLAMAVGANHAKHKPRLSKDPLTADQVAIYRAVLEQYVEKDPSVALNIANRTEALGSSWLAGQIECPKGLTMETAPQPQIVHRLGLAVALGPNMVLVDAKRQAELVKRL